LREAYGPVWGFAAGWMSLLAGFSAPIAAALLAARHLRGLVPFLSAEPVAAVQSELFAMQLGPMEFTAALLILLFSALNWFGLRLTGHVQTCLTSLNVLLVAGFVVAGFLLGDGDWSNLTSPPAPSNSASVPGRVAIGLIWVAFSFSGWNAATYVAEEVRRPEKTLPRALLLGTAVAAVLYLSLNTLLVYAVPVGAMEGTWRGGSLAASELFGAGSGRIVSALVALTLIASASAMLASGPRVYYAMARDGAFFSLASRIHPRWKTPSGAVAVQAFCALAIAFVSLPNLISYIGVSLTFCTALAVGSLLVMRRRPGWKTLPLVSFAYPALPLACLSIAGMMAFYGALLKPVPSLTAAATVIGGCWLCKGLLHPADQLPIEQPGSRRIRV
jgi:APA family basic amino acid/polyamine antiporter